MLFLADALLAGVLFAGALLVCVLLDGVLSVDEDDLDWAVADGKKPSEDRKKIPAKTATAKRRTQTLPTA